MAGPGAASPDDPTDDGADAGQATAEFALVLPVMFVVLVGLIQVAGLARDEVLVWNAAREAGRQAAIEDAPAAGPVREAALRGAPGLDPSRLSVAVSGGAATGDEVTVEVTYRSSWLLNGVRPVDHRATATFRKE